MFDETYYTWYTMPITALIQHDVSSKYSINNQLVEKHVSN